jgi:hypothetical protein
MDASLRAAAVSSLAPGMTTCSMLLRAACTLSYRSRLDRAELLGPDTHGLASH